MSEFLAYLRERLPLARFVPVAVFLGLLGGPPTHDRAAMIGLAWVMLAAFRIRDDLADRERDAIDHPGRVLVRARSIHPFVWAELLSLAIAVVGLSLAHGLARGLGLIVVVLVFELGYRLELPARHRWVLLKYPVFAALLADTLAPALAGLCYLSFVVYERLDDPKLRSRTDAGLRLAAYLLVAATLAWAQLLGSAASLGWFVLVGVVMGLVAELARSRSRGPGGRIGLFLVTALVWAHGQRVPGFGIVTEFGGFAQALWLTLPVTLAGLTHVIAIKHDLLPQLARIRLDGGLELRGRPLFGVNKTLRGAVVMIGASVVWTVVVDLVQRALGLDDSLRFIAREQLGSVGLGFTLGIAYIVGELPNSLIKRQLDVEPGGAPRGWARPLVWTVDQIDSAVAILAALSLFRTPAPSFALTLLGLALAVHPAVAAIMVALGLKRRIG